MSSVDKSGCYSFEKLETTNFFGSILTIETFVSVYFSCINLDVNTADICLSWSFVGTFKPAT